MNLRQPVPTITSAVVRIWARWKVVAPSIGNFQARVLLSVFYFVVVPPFALIGAAALLKPE